MSALSYAREEWKSISFGKGYTNKIRIEVSNFGRIKSYNKFTQGNYLTGSLIGGYRIIRLKLFKPRDEKVVEQLRLMKAQLDRLIKKTNGIKEKLGDKSIRGSDRDTLKKELETEELSLKVKTKKYRTVFHKDLISRTVYFGFLIHRLVAEHFLPKPAADQTIACHLDHDKENNKVSNLKWMTPAEKSIHYNAHPDVKAAKAKRKLSGLMGRPKLTTTKVMYLKKLLNEGKPLRSLAKQFKVSETQILRIKRNENWTTIEAAK